MKLGTVHNSWWINWKITFDKVWFEKIKTYILNYILQLRKEKKFKVSKLNIIIFRWFQTYLVTKNQSNWENNKHEMKQQNKLINWV